MCQCTPAMGGAVPASDRSARPLRRSPPRPITGAPPPTRPSKSSPPPPTDRSLPARRLPPIDAQQAPQAAFGCRAEVRVALAAERVRLFSLAARASAGAAVGLLPGGLRRLGADIHHHTSVELCTVTGVHSSLLSCDGGSFFETAGSASNNIIILQRLHCCFLTEYACVSSPARNI